MSRADLALDGSRVRAALVFRADDAALAVSGLDGDGDGHVSQGEVDRAAAALKVTFIDSVQVVADESRCLGLLDAAELEGPDGLRLHGTYTCPHLPARLRFHFGFFDLMPSSHRSFVTVHTDRGNIEALCTMANPDLDVRVSDTSSHGFVSLLRGGIGHILGGADHLAFLIALVVGTTMMGSGARWGPLVGMLTAFTVGHSVSLAIATLGGITPGTRIVEPAVALSVAYVGAENLFARAAVARRWRLTLAFGFVHGFAFAGGLLPLGLPRAQLPAALFAFNLGVETGQLLVLAVLLPPLAWLGSRPWYRTAARALSVAIALAGAAWFVQRVA